jgi:hypothetical protein
MEKITSAKNPLIRDMKALNQRKGRMEQGRFLVEGEKMIREALPNATVVVSSILPARDPAFERSDKWRNIPDWSKVLEAACKENNILFANCDDLAEDYPKLWDPDGIHFRKEFYPYWASRLVVTTLMED